MIICELKPSTPGLKKLISTSNIDSALCITYRSSADANGAGSFFNAWENLLNTELAEENNEKADEGFTVFTVTDEIWQQSIPTKGAKGGIFSVKTTIQFFTRPSS